MLHSLRLPMLCCYSFLLISCFMQFLSYLLQALFMLCSYCHHLLSFQSSSCCFLLLNADVLMNITYPYACCELFLVLCKDVCIPCALMTDKDMLILSLQLLQRFWRRMVYISFVSLVQGGVFFLLLCLVGVFWT